MTFKSLIKSAALVAAVLTFAVPVMAQWQWIDKDGSKVFSDRSPPADIKDKDILKRPGGRVTNNAATTPSAPAPTPVSSAASTPKLSGKDSELEAKKKQAEQAEAAQKKAEEDKQAKAKEENCNRAKVALTTLQSGIRMATVNAAGEREVMDDAKRASETKRLKEAADANCKK